MLKIEGCRVLEKEIVLDEAYIIFITKNKKKHQLIIINTNSKNYSLSVRCAIIFHQPEK